MATEADVPKPLVLAIAFVNGKEVLKRPIRASCFSELERASKCQSPALLGSKLCRTLHFSKVFQEFIDVDDEHAFEMHDRFQLYFEGTDSPESSFLDEQNVTDNNPSQSPPQGPSTAQEPTQEVQIEGSTQEADYPDFRQLEEAALNLTCERIGLVQPLARKKQGEEPMSSEQMIEEAKIFGKGKQDANLTRYQKEINNVAVSIVQENPMMLFNRGELLKQARLKLHASGYIYKRGKVSRSKVFGNEQGSQSKKSKYSVKHLKDKLKQLSKEVDNVEKQLRLYQKSLQQCYRGGTFIPPANFEGQVTNFDEQASNCEGQAQNQLA